MEGWIKLHRQLSENPLWLIKPFSEGQAWVDLLLVTTFDKGFIKTKNGTVIKLNRGECGYSILTLSKRWGWSRGKVTRFLSLLNKEKMIQQKTISNTTVINILNYETYQDGAINSTINDTINGQQTIQQTDTINNVKNDNNEKNVFLLEEKREKKLDPFINPIKTFFIEECQKQLKKMPRLSSFECNRLIELASENSDIKELIPVAISKLKGIKFDDINFKPSVNWLLKGNNFERVINGEFDGLKKEKESRPEYSTEYKPFILSEEDAKEAEITRLKISESIKAKRRG